MASGTSGLAPVGANHADPSQLARFRLLGLVLVESIAGGGDRVECEPHFAVVVQVMDLELTDAERRIGCIQIGQGAGGRRHVFSVVGGTRRLRLADDEQPRRTALEGELGDFAGLVLGGLEGQQDLVSYTELFGDGVGLAARDHETVGGDVGRSPGLDGEFHGFARAES